MFRWGGLKGIEENFGSPLKKANKRCPPPLVGLFWLTKYNAHVNIVCMKANEVAELNAAINLISTRAMASYALHDVTHSPTEGFTEVDQNVWDGVLDVMSSIFGQPESAVFGPITDHVDQKNPDPNYKDLERTLTLPELGVVRVSFANDTGEHGFSMDLMPSTPDSKEFRKRIGDEIDPLVLVDLNLGEFVKTDFLIDCLETARQIRDAAIEADQAPA